MSESMAPAQIEGLRTGEFPPSSVLVVSHSPELRVYIQKGMAVGDLESSTVTDLGEARDLLCSDSTFGIVVVELEDPLSEGSSKALSVFCRDFHHLDIVGIAPNPSPELVRDALRIGLRDFLTDPFDARSIADAVTREPQPGPQGAPGRPGGAESEKGRPPEKTETLRARGSTREIITANPKMTRLLAVVDKVAPTDSTVLIEGESGTGKELIARRIHSLSRRDGRPFVEVHCGAIPANLLESELFGHEKGSFTGAVSRQIGLFEAADRGTIFLDEIAEMDLDMQVKLLRVLQEQTFRRIGGKNPVKVNVRVIAATNRDLKTEVENKRFRADLYYRINVISVEMVPLRERIEDIEELVTWFAQRFHREKGLPLKTFAPETIQRMMQLRWVGNVRELENLVERLLLLSSGDVVEPGDLVEYHTEVINDVPSEPLDPRLTLDDVKKIHIANVLKANEGNKMKSARMLGINIKTLYNLIQRLDIPT